MNRYAFRIWANDSRLAGVLLNSGRLDAHDYWDAVRVLFERFGELSNYKVFPVKVKPTPAGADLSTDSGRG